VVIYFPPTGDFRVSKGNIGTSIILYDAYDVLG